MSSTPQSQLASYQQVQVDLVNLNTVPTSKFISDFNTMLDQFQIIHGQEYTPNTLNVDAPLLIVPGGTNAYEINVADLIVAQYPNVAQGAFSGVLNLRIRALSGSTGSGTTAQKFVLNFGGTQNEQVLFPKNYGTNSFQLNVAIDLEGLPSPGTQWGSLLAVKSDDGTVQIYGGDGGNTGLQARFFVNVAYNVCLTKFTNGSGPSQFVGLLKYVSSTCPTSSTRAGPYGEVLPANCPAPFSNSYAVKYNPS